MVTKKQISILFLIIFSGVLWTASAFASYTAEQIYILERVIYCLNNAVEDQDVAGYLKGNFSDDRLMRQAAQSLWFGRQDKHLAKLIRKKMDRQ